MAPYKSPSPVPAGLYSKTQQHRSVAFSRRVERTGLLCQARGDCFHPAEGIGTRKLMNYTVRLLLYLLYSSPSSLFQRTFEFEVDKVIHFQRHILMAVLETGSTSPRLSGPGFIFRWPRLMR